MAELLLRCFGGFQATLLGKPLALFQTDKTRALLVYLAVERRVHQRSELAHFFWPGYSEESARNSLRQSLYQLRQLLHDAEADPPWLLLTRQTVQINSAAQVHIDALDFTQLLADCAAHPHSTLATCPDCLLRLRRIVELYHGDFLVDFSLADSDPFEEWRRILQEQLHIQMMNALAQLANATETLGDADTALQAAQRQLALEPWWEPAYRQIMRLLARRGQRTAALAQYQRCRQVLDEELHVEPDAETTALYEQIQRGDFDKPLRTGKTDGFHALAPLAPVVEHPHGIAQPERAAAPILSHGAPLPILRSLYGREREAATLYDWLTHAESRLILLLGIGGVGKTALAAHLVRTVTDRFEVVIWSSLLNAPLFGEILRQWLGVLVQASEITPPADEEAQLRLLLTCLRQQRCLLVLDNAESILLNKAESEEEGGGATGAMRPGYEGYERLLHSVSQAEHQSCLLITSRELPRGLRNTNGQPPFVQILALAGLERQAGQALLQAQGLTPDEHTTRLLVDQYSGNPLALQIVSHTIVDLYGGDIHAFTAEGTPIFDDIRAILDQQIARLSGLERELLLWLAIEREPTAPTALRNNLVDKGPQRTFLEALRGLQRRSLLEKVGDGCFTLQNVIIEYLTDRFVEEVYAEFKRWANDAATPALPARTIFSSHFNHHALLKADAPEAVRQSQIRLIVQPIAERLGSIMGKSAFAAQAQRWLDWLRASELPLRGYAAGNLLNLLLHLEIDITGFNFSRLAVWQAFLRGAYLPQLDFTEADLTGAVFTHRFGEIYALLFNEQNELTVAGMRDDSLQIWRAVTGELLVKCPLDELRSNRVGWSNDGRIAAVAAGDGTVQLFDVLAGRRLHTLIGATHAIWQIRISADNQQVACGDASGQILIWTVDGQLLYRLQGHTTPITGMAYAAGDRPELLATAAVDGSICLWDAHSGKRLQRLHGHTGEVAALGFAANGTVLASGSNDFSARLWDVNSGRLLHTLLRHTQPIRNLAVTPLGNLLATGSGDKLVYIWDIQTGEVRHILGNHTVIVARLSFSPDEQTLATFDLNGRLSLWNVQQGQRVDAFQIYRNAIRSADLNVAQQRVIAGGGDGALYLWALDEESPASSQPALIDRIASHEYNIAAVAFSPDGETFASGDTGRTILLHNLRTKRHQALLGHQSNIVALKFSADGQWLASGSGDGTIGVWSAHNGQRYHTLRGHTNAVTFCCFSPDDAQIASSSLDLTVCLWDAKRGKLRHQLRGHTNVVQSVAFSADGQRVISSSFDQTLRVWDTETGQLLATWPTPNTTIISLSMHPNGRLLAAGAQDQRIYLWELAGGRILGTLTGHNYAVDSVNFSRDGRLLLSASQDETVKLWRVDPYTGNGVCLKTYTAPGPYAGMKIAGVAGISDGQKAALVALGAVDAL